MPGKFTQRGILELVLLTRGSVSVSMPRFQTITASPSRSPPELKKTRQCLSSAVSDSVRPSWTVAPLDPSVHGDSPGQETLEWVAMPSSRGSSPPRDRTQVFGHGRQILYQWRHWGNCKSHTVQNVQGTSIYNSCDVEATFSFCARFLRQLALLRGAERMELDAPLCLPFFLFSSWVSIQGACDFSRISVDGLGLGGFPGGRTWAGIPGVLGEGGCRQPRQLQGRVRLGCSGIPASCKASGSR